MLENLPEGTQHLIGAMFSVPFSSIVIPDRETEKGDQYQFFNPRMLTERGQSDLMDKQASQELRESIKIRTLLNPLICRWVRQANGMHVPQLVGGDRRYRALEFLIRKKEMVTDPRSMYLGDDGLWAYKQASADEAYATIPCQIFAVSNDLEALALAWAENKSRIDLTEGHEIAEVINLRKVGASDEKILEILQHDEKWLAESDRLIKNLDESTLTDLVESRMTRACAIELAQVEDLVLRDKIRIKANEAAVESCNRKVKRYQKQVESALDELEIAEGYIADAEFHKDDAGIEAATAKAEDASKKVARTVKERDATTPVATAKDVKDAKTEIAGDDDLPRPLRAPKIKACLEYVDTLIQSEGEGELDGNTFTINVDSLKLVRGILNNNILAGDDNFAATIAYYADR